MSSFMNDFNIFFSSFLSGLQSFFSWMLSTVLGEVILFTVIISLFFFVLNLIFDFKKS